MKLRLLAATAAIMLPLSSAPAGQFYGDINYEMQYFDISSQSFTPQMFSASVGAWLLQGIGIEATYGMGFRDDTENGFSLETSQLGAVNLRFESPNTMGASAYILLGSVSFKLDGDISGSGFPGKETFNGYQVTLGVNQYFPNHPRTALNLSATKYGVDEDFDSYGLRVGLRRDF